MTMSSAVACIRMPYPISEVLAALAKQGAPKS